MAIAVGAVGYYESWYYVSFTTDLETHVGDLSRSNVLSILGDSNAGDIVGVARQAVLCILGDVLYNDCVTHGVYDVFFVRMNLETGKHFTCNRKKTADIFIAWWEMVLARRKIWPSVRPSFLCLGSSLLNIILLSSEQA